MAENYGDYANDDTDGQHRRQSFDVLTLAAGLVSLLLAAYVLVGGLPGLELRWVLAGGAVLVGALMLAASMRRR